ncbi:MAG: hypothetical protein IPI38_19725 [Gemmatimonadetes bacterium]|nr:hypothetical protein [Gemmatimonadota bacterium]
MADLPAETIQVPDGLTPADTVLEDFIPKNPRCGGTGRLDLTPNGCAKPRRGLAPPPTSW